MLIGRRDERMVKVDWRGWLGRTAQRGTDLVGGRARARVILVLGLALGLQGADLGAVSAAAGNLEHVFGLSNTGIGLLVSATALAGAVATVPVGVLTDHTRRTRLMAISAAAWTLAILASGAALSFAWLIAARVVLGIVTATSGPTVASLTGDFFPARVRAGILGFVLGGELVGTGVGVLISGELAGLIGWRWAFWWLVGPGVLVVWALWRLPEPARDGQSRLRPGQLDIPDERDVHSGDHAPERRGGESARAREPVSAVGRAMERHHIQPRPQLVLHENPVDSPLLWVVRYVLRVPTNRILILASALGYFYFSGLRSFALIFVTGHYGLSKAQASPLVVVLGLGAVAGIYLGGRTADHLLARGTLTARLIVPTVSLVAVVLLFLPAILVNSVAIAIPLFFAGAGFLGAINPPLDAARLDIIHPALWGRAEGVRTLLRGLAEAGAPLLFGWVSVSVFSGPTGLQQTFLIFLVVLVAGAALAATALRTYPADVAAAARSYRRIQEGT
jgi:predicted MFS family arabinose efflux permease